MTSLATSQDSPKVTAGSGRALAGLVLVETAPDGAVVQLTPCPEGIDQAVVIVAGRLTHPEEDWATAVDIFADQWAEMAAGWSDEYSNELYPHVVFTRRGYSSRFGLAVVE